MIGKREVKQVRMRGYLKKTTAGKPMVTK